MRPPGDILIQALLWVIPELVALIVALVLVITGRHRKPAAFFMIAIGILVFLRFLWPF